METISIFIGITVSHFMNLKADSFNLSHEDTVDFALAQSVEIVAVSTNLRMVVYYESVISMAMAGNPIVVVDYLSKIFELLLDVPVCISSNTMVDLWSNQVIIKVVIAS